jgi:hypothetical protein
MTTVPRDIPQGRSWERDGHRVPVTVLGCALSTFFTLTYLLCIVGCLLFPALPVEHGALGIFLPGFTMLSW